MENINIPQAIDIRASEQWETVLLSSDPETDLNAVQMADDAARDQGLLTAI